MVYGSLSLNATLYFNQFQITFFSPPGFGRGPFTECLFIIFPEVLIHHGNNGMLVQWSQWQQSDALTGAMCKCFLLTLLPILPAAVVFMCSHCSLRHGQEERVWGRTCTHTKHSLVSVGISLHSIGPSCVMTAGWMQ